MQAEDVEVIEEKVVCVTRQLRRDENHVDAQLQGVDKHPDWDEGSTGEGQDRDEDDRYNEKPVRETQRAVHGAEIVEVHLPREFPVYFASKRNLFSIHSDEVLVCVPESDHNVGSLIVWQTDRLRVFELEIDFDLFVFVLGERPLILNVIDLVTEIVDNLHLYGTQLDYLVEKLIELRLVQIDCH